MVIQTSSQSWHTWKERAACRWNKAHRLVMELDWFTIIEGVLYLIDSSRSRRLRIAAPSTIQETLLKENHSGSLSGHFSSKSVHEKLARLVGSRDVVQHCKTSLTCASYQGAGRRNTPPLKPIEVGGPFEWVGVNILEIPPAETENRHIIVVFSDHLTKWVKAFPTADQTSDIIAHLLVERITCQHGAPKELSDHGPNLLSTLMPTWTESHNAHKSFQMYPGLDISKEREEELRRKSNLKLRNLTLVEHTRTISENKSARTRSKEVKMWKDHYDWIHWYSHWRHIYHGPGYFLLTATVCITKFPLCNKWIDYLSVDWRSLASMLHWM